MHPVKIAPSFAKLSAFVGAVLGVFHNSNPPRPTDEPSPGRPAKLLLPGDGRPPVWWHIARGPVTRRSRNKARWIARRHPDGVWRYDGPVTSGGAR